MKVEFDPAKDRANRDKHGLSLSEGEAVFADPDHFVSPSVRIDDREERSKVIGMVRGRLHTAVFTRRGDAIRFISVRKSNGSETRVYTSRS